MAEEQKPPEKCPQCGKKVEYFAIPLKDGRIWKFWGCVDRTNCKWVFKPPSKTELRHDEVMNALRKIYAKIVSIEKKVEELSLRIVAKQLKENEQKEKEKGKNLYQRT